MIKQGDIIKIIKSNHICYQKIIKGIEIKYFDGIYRDTIISYDVPQSIYEDTYVVIGFEILNKIWIKLWVLNLSNGEYYLISYDIGVKESNLIRVLEVNLVSTKLKLKLVYGINIDRWLRIKIFNMKEI